MSASWSRIAAVMRERDWSKADLARKAGLSASSLQKWERGGKITLDSVMKIATALGVSPDSLSDTPGARLQEEHADYASGPCRIPVGMDVKAEMAAVSAKVDAMQEAMARLEGQMRTLTELLGGALRSGIESRKQAG